MHEMHKLVEGVELDETAEVIGPQNWELEVEGIDLDQSQEERKEEEDSEAT